MSSKTRDDLPTKISQTYSKQDIELFDKYRQYYKDGVSFLKTLYTSQTTKIDDVIEEFMITHLSNDITPMVLMMMRENTFSVQKLTKYTTIKQGLDNIIRFSRSVDMITAFYIPANLEYLELWFNNTKIARYQGDNVDIDIELLLHDSLNVPADVHLETILWQSLQEKNRPAHSRENEMILDGELYKRIVFVEPYLNIAGNYYVTISLQSSDNRNIYVEENLIDYSNRNKLIKDDNCVSWINHSTLRSPLIMIINSGIINITKLDKYDHDHDYFM